MRFIFCLIIIAFYAVSACAKTQALSSCPIELLPSRKSMSVAQGQADFWQNLSEEKLTIYARQGHVPAMKQVISQALTEKRSVEYWDHYIDIYNSLTCHKGAAFVPDDRVGSFIYTSVLTTLRREIFPERLSYEYHGRGSEFATMEKRKKFDNVIAYAQSFLSLKPSQAMALEFPASETKPLVELLSYMQRRWFLVEMLLLTEDQDAGSSLNLLADLYRAGGIVKREVAKSDNYKARAFLADARYLKESYIQYYSKGCFAGCRIYSLFYFASGKVIIVDLTSSRILESEIKPSVFVELESIVFSYVKNIKPFTDKGDEFSSVKIGVWGNTKYLNHQHDISLSWQFSSGSNYEHSFSAHNKYLSKLIYELEKQAPFENEGLCSKSKKFQQVYDKYWK